MCSTIVSKSSSSPDFWIISPCKWENSALTHLIESFGWSASQSGDLKDTWPSTNLDKKLPVILAVIGRHDEAVLSDLFKKFPEAPIVLLLRHRLKNLATRGLPSNVMAAVEATQPSTTLHSVLSLVTSGHRVLPSHYTEADAPIAKTPVKATKPPLYEEVLTGREKEVSREISLGKSNKDIARRLGISLNTVNAHTAAIRQKLGVSNRTQIAMQMAHLVATARPDPSSPVYARGSGSL